MSRRDTRLPGAARTGVLIALTVLCWQVGTGWGQSCFEAGTGSQLTVSGSAKVRSFSCASNTIHGRAFVRTSAADSIDIELRVPVRSFNCGRSAMNEDLYEALQGDRHPYIRYRVHRAETVSTDDSTHNRIEVVGSLTMAGTTRQDTTVVEGRRLSGENFHIEGGTSLSLRRFGVTPPTALFGLIQVQDSVTVSANLLGTPECAADG